LRALEKVIRQAVKPQEHEVWRQATAPWDAAEPRHKTSTNYTL